MSSLSLDISKKDVQETPFGSTPLETWTLRAFVRADWLRSFLADKHFRSKHSPNRCKRRSLRFGQIRRLK